MLKIILVAVVDNIAFIKGFPNDYDIFKKTDRTCSGGHNFVCQILKLGLRLPKIYIQLHAKFQNLSQKTVIQVKADVKSTLYRNQTGSQVFTSQLLSSIKIKCEISWPPSFLKDRPQTTPPNRSSLRCESSSLKVVQIDSSLKNTWKCKYFFTKCMPNINVKCNKNQCAINLITKYKFMSIFCSAINE